MPNQRLPQVRAKHTIAEAQAAAEQAALLRKELRQESQVEQLPDDWFEQPEAKPLPANLVDRYKLGTFAHQPDVRTQVARKRGDPISWDEEEVIETLRKYNGNVALAAKALGSQRAALDQYRRRTPSVQAVCQEIFESKLDNTESVLYDRAVHGEAWAVTFLLKTQGRGRGYIERGETLNVRIDLNKLTDEQLRRIANGEHPTIVMGDPSAGGDRSAEAWGGHGRVIDGEAELLLDAPAEAEAGAAESGT